MNASSLPDISIRELLSAISDAIVTTTDKDVTITIGNAHIDEHTLCKVAREVAASRNAGVRGHDDDTRLLIRDLYLRGIQVSKVDPSHRDGMLLIRAADAIRALMR